ncbi:MAG: AAA domain-containing protein [Gaiellaceae bacterium]
MSTPPDERTLESAVLPDEVDGFSKRRVELVQTAVKEWTTQLIDLGGRNNLIRYRDLKAGTLDLTEARGRAVTSLLQNRSVKISALFPDREVRDQVLKRVRTIYNKARENFEERGLQTLSLACGLATWENQRAAWEPCAPVLLRSASLRSLGAAQDEFELALVDEMEVNPTLLHVLKVDFDCEVDEDKLLDRIDGVIDEPWELEETYGWLKEQARRVPGIDVAPRIVLTNFAYAKLPMVRDIENAFDELVASDLIAAIAGDEEARESVRAKAPGSDAVLHPDDTPLANEFLVLDADSSQNYAINAVHAGESLIIKGPPGTGKSQTIANLIGSLVAGGKKVLFVAEKRAAIDAVLKRLNQQKLGNLVLDLHEGVSSRRAFAGSIYRALNENRTTRPVDNGADIRKLETRRSDLNEYVEALHRSREPWGVSIFDARSRLIDLASDPSSIRFRDTDLTRLDAEAARRAEDELIEFARLGGFSLHASGSPWARSQIVSQEEVQRARALVDELRRHTLPAALSLLERASEATALPGPSCIDGWVGHLRLWREIESTLSFFRASIYDVDLPHLRAEVAAAADGSFARLRASLLSSDYKAARQELRDHRASDEKAGDEELLGRATDAQAQLERWRSVKGAGTPNAPGNLSELEGAHQQLRERLRQLATFIGGQESEVASSTDPSALGAMAPGDLERLLASLFDDHSTLVKLPELHHLRGSLTALGLEPLLEEATEQIASEEGAVRRFHYARLQSILEEVSLTDLPIGTFSADVHEKAIEEFQARDRSHIAVAAARIRRAAAEAATRIRDEFREQAELVSHQASLKRRHMPVRDLVRNAPDVLLGLKPCWAMSPLVVSQLLPSKTLFDVVIFDEASQITPADAVTSIIRGQQLVVAGDEHQLPPTAFFVSDGSDENEEEAEASVLPLVGGTKGFESILDALASLLRFRLLAWHYRSRDERLIAFSNAHIYDRTLTTFPGAAGGTVLRHVLAPWDPATNTNSPTPEVEAVVRLVIEHAREKPEESLGVITMGIKHANRIGECLRQRLSDDSSLEEEVGEFFGEDQEERFFVKNLERVQGDERDAIILSIGYGKNARGDLPYRFGPLLMEGGERRLNVAVTRAKRRVTLVSSFGSKDMDPEKSSAEGVKLLRHYLQYVESAGTNLGDQVVEKPALNPFEVDVRDTLARQGLKLIAQYGCSGYWIDFAVQHPTEPGRFVLAIECDGATYHSSESARDRDRLRQEQLERLGWRFHRIWSSEWFYEKEKAVAKVMEAYRRALDEGSDGVSVSRNDPPESHEDDATGEPTLPAERTLPRPNIRRGVSIDYYSHRQLIQVIRWIESDGLLRTQDDLLEEAICALHFKRRGKKIVAALRVAIREARAS